MSKEHFKETLPKQARESETILDEHELEWECFEIHHIDQGVRADLFIAEQFEDHSRSQVQNWFRQQKVIYNGKAIKKNRSLQAGGELKILRPEPPIPPHVDPEPMDLDIVFEDKDFLIVNKPKGVVVHPGAGNQTGTLIAGVLHHCGTLSEVGDGSRPGVVHRLDKDTTGLLIVAKKEDSHHKLSQQLQERDISRTYHAIVWGHPNEEQGTLKFPIGRDRQNRLKKAVNPKGRYAVTHYRVKEYFEFASLLEIKLETGRTHQIRVHMSHIGCPIVGDELYNGREYSIDKREPMERERALKMIKIAQSQSLQAVRLKLTHPTTGEPHSFSSPPHPEFQALLDYCRTTLPAATLEEG